MSVLINTYSCRTNIVIGGLLCTLCYFDSFFLIDINSFIIVLGVIGGIANSLTTIPAVVILAYYFQERRNLFISLSSVVVGVGMIIASPLGLYLLETYGLHGTFLIIGGLNAQICVFGMLCKPSSVELSIQKHHRENQIACKTQRKLREHSISVRGKLSRLGSVLSIDLLLNIPFLLFLLSTMSWSLMLTICLQHLPNYLFHRGATDAQVSEVMSAFSLSHTLGRFLATVIASKGSLDFMTLHFGLSGIIGVVSVAFPFYSYIPNSEFMYAVVVGLYTGVLNTLLTPITLCLVEVKRISAAYGMSFCFSGMGLILGPYIAGLLFDITGLYDSTFFTGGTVVMCGCVLGIAAAIYTKSVTEASQPEQRSRVENSEKLVSAIHKEIHIAEEANDSV